MTPNVHLPPSVKAYLTDPAVRTGVEALLRVELDALPADLQWDEYGDYLAARAAAELTRLEWAPLLHQLWQQTWGAQISTRWKVCSFEQMTDDEQYVTPEACWDSKTLSVMHSTNETFWLYSSVRADTRSTSIAFALLNAENEPILNEDFEEFRWIDDDKWDGWLVASVPHHVAASQFDLTVLSLLAIDAIGRVADMTSVGSASD